MPQLTDRLRAWLIPLGCALLFFLAGLAVLPWPGLQNDELFFVGPLMLKGSAYFQVEFRHHSVPIMLLTYLGTLKTWIYDPLLKWFPPTVWTVRLPMLMVGTATIWLTWLWVRRLAGTRAAAVATVLLATDTLYLLTVTFDWGPVALQHLFLIGGLLAVQIWIDAPERWRMLAFGLFLWGVGLWDKELLIWPLAGLAVALVCVWPRETFARIRGLSAKAIVIALLAFLIGAAPLIDYKLSKQGRQAPSNFSFYTADIAQKVRILSLTIQGDALYGYMVYGAPDGKSRRPENGLAQAADWIATHTGEQRSNAMLPAWLLAIACGLFGWRSSRRRQLIFLLIATAVAWIQMAIGKDTGGGLHHTILLWPLPPIFIGIAFSAAAERIPRFGSALLVVVVALLAVENLLTTNQFLVTAMEEGGYQGWTDAIDPLSRELEAQPTRPVGLVDWGYQTQLQLLGHGKLRLFLASEPDKDPAEITQSPNALYVQHTADKQMFPGGNERFVKAAAALGFEEKVDRVISDRNGRPVFEVFHLVKN